MFGFIKRGLYLNKVSKSMDMINLILYRLEPLLERGHNDAEIKNEILTIAYISRKGIFDRIEKNNWTLDVAIAVTSIGRNYISLSSALKVTHGKAQSIADALDYGKEYREILEGGNAFLEFERQIPNEIKIR